MQIKNHLFILFTLLFCIHPALAEVMDKEPSSINIWLWTFFASVIGFIVCRYKPIFGILSFAAIALYLFSILTETLQPDINPSILHEAGLPYILQLMLAFVLAATSHISGVIINKRKTTKVLLQHRNSNFYISLLMIK